MYIRLYMVWILEKLKFYRRDKIDLITLIVFEFRDITYRKYMITNTIKY